MTMKMKILAGLLILVLQVLLVASCATAPSDTTPAPTAKPTETKPTETKPSETSTPKEAEELKIEVLPESLNGFSIAGQRIVYLVSILKGAADSASAAEIFAEADNADTTVEHKTIEAGEVAEVIVIPKANSAGKSVNLTITAKLGSNTDSKKITFDVIEGEDDRKDYATELRDKFVAWLEANHPEMGIAKDTAWTGTMVSPQWLVVSHYLFFSYEWEMHVEWHIMVAPDDWARIDLRKRFSESKPSSAFEISSREGNTTPKPLEVPESIWR